METIERQCRRVERMERERRRRAVMLSRLRINVRRPVNLAIVVLVLALGGSASTWIKLPFPGGDGFPGLVMVWDYTISLLILILSMLSSVVILTMPPLNAKNIESGLEHIKLVDRYGLSPVLISSYSLKQTNIRQLFFYSRGIGKEVWEKRRQAIEDVLNVHYVSPIQYGGKNGNNRNFIVLVVAPGAETKREEPLYDDEL